jgi:DNA-directed RNA polymerase III subunit RPC8
MDGTEFDNEENVWIWKFQDNDLFMDLNEQIRFRVESDAFTDKYPVGDEKVVEPPFKIMASCAEQGLGLVIWWE